MCRCPHAVLLILLLQAPLPVVADETARYAELAGRIADGIGLDRDLVQAVIAAESAYDPDAVSPVGAVGLMQVMPETARDYGVEGQARLAEPATNLATGMRHLKRLLEKYDNIGQAVMAYNAGEGALARGGGRVDYPETQRYTHRVLTDYLGRKGVAPYSEAARALLGIELSPAMARAGGERRAAPGARAYRVASRDGGAACGRERHARRSSGRCATALRAAPETRAAGLSAGAADGALAAAGDLQRR
ncbi:lytic transglycosylase domain-containing protein [Marichromatium sp. AB32]|uniref:lytic transglycosylase domain-containing protein n=1 Tax=Marichromatium sp. AB32 TaxID=2483363 RepID=UPI000F41D49B|nr:lytic transglycosylase domain-containing protein [Marichromatium sp. AB32]RNE94207.1 lytic transglycosylase domain-containing protein [Marichromatium sp. AB32]